MKRRDSNHPGLWRWMRRLNQRIARNYMRGIGPRRLVLLLTTIGRKYGLPRVTPLQYEEVDGEIYVASARGQRADWFRNILENSQVQVQIGDDHFAGEAEPIMDPVRIADFLDYRLRRHPIMIRLMLSAEGLPLRFNRADLEKFARGKALVVIHRQENKVRRV